MALGKSPAALVVAIGIFLSRIAGLVRDRVFAYYLGNSVAAGAFRAALRIPNFLQNLFGEGVLSASFIPVYARLRAEGQDKEAVHLAGAIGALLGCSVTLLAGIGILAAPWIIDVLAPGFDAPAVRDLTVHLVQIMFPGVALLVMSAWCLGVLNSHRHFLLSYIAPVLWNAAIICALLWSGSRNPMTDVGQTDIAIDVAWGTIVGCALQFLVQLPLVLRLTRGLRLVPSSKSSAVRTVLRNFLPVLTSRGVVQISAYIDGVIASFLGPAVYAAMAYAQTLYLLPISLFGMSISAAELPAMSSVIGSEEVVKEQLRKKLVSGLKRVSFFVVPSVVAMALLGEVVIATVYQTGQFKHADVMSGWLILAGSTIGLLASTQGRLCSTAFYAMRDSRTPLYFACIRVLLTAVTGYLLALPVRSALGLSSTIGAAFLTGSAGLAGWVEFLMLRRALSKKIGAFAVATTLQIQLWAAATFSGTVGFALKLALPEMYPILTGLIVLGVYGLLYLGVTTAFGFGEGLAIRQALMRHRR